MSIKILMNSLYGALGNRWFRYFDQRVAESVTLAGQLSILWAEKAINEEMNRILDTDKDYVIAIDTDSLYINMSALVDKTSPKNPIAFLDKICSDHFERTLETSYDQLARYTGAYENRMEMGRGTRRQRYLGCEETLHSERPQQRRCPVQKAQIKLMGIEAVKSSTPQVVQINSKKYSQSL